ncbi:MAG TPA: hypothetical protein VHS58_02955 [Acetobacteraceae bacterium]|nr:hypothetical protein [Acetobacteraceae bacterium]
MIDTDIWSTAPKEGSVIKVQFPDGTENTAKWDTKARQWDARLDGEWVSMAYAHGTRTPVVWWRESM